MTAVHATLDAFGTYLFVAVRRAAALGPPPSASAKAVVADVDATCSRFRDDSDLGRANAATGRVGRRRPAAGGRRRRRLRGAAATGGLVAPAARADPGAARLRPRLPADCCAATVHPVPDRRATPPAPTPGARSGSTPRARSGSRRAPRSTSARPPRRGPPTWSPTAIEAELGEPALVSLGGDVRIAAPDGPGWKIAVSERPGRRPCSNVSWPQRRPRDVEHAGPPLDATRGAVRHHLLDPRTGGPSTEVWRTVSATGPTCVGRQHRLDSRGRAGGDGPRAGWPSGRGRPAEAASGQVVTTGGWPATGPGSQDGA